MQLTLIAAPALAGTLGLLSLAPSPVVGPQDCPASQTQCTKGADRVVTVADPVQRTGNIVEVASSAGHFSTLVTAVGAAGLVDVLSGPGPFTVLAPTDEAFAQLDEGLLESLLQPENRATLAAVLKNHVIAGKVPSSAVAELTETRPLGGQRLSINVADGAVHIGGATVITADVAASNGVIHVIDRVLVPNTADVIDTALADGRFGTLAKALTAGGLVEALRAEGPFTVFAPTDAAFAKLDPATLSALLEPANRDQLVAILQYHVVPGRISARDAVGAGVATTLGGKDLRVRIADGQVLAGNGRVVVTDIEAANGVIHVVDTVLIP
ncbi:fasciclin domain-containing protein [Engelhardtia mirabilis]|uniref:Immunogenic protein MPT70 n=1 Tax=Engelhardtia mirabilis TaxID=2528011 RepID=A0A518BF57_9BACT|nr:Immunogenic protein MPT70 precursor [Planctomycetes bacterium Pla133]QDU99943.1 Immunogenic protein MPT70 precursor [Planctomycetes bacterium Pla86]